MELADNPLKIVIPMAGLGTRLRPHTWSKPKPLISLAGQTVLEHILDMFASLPDPANFELIFIVGHLRDQIKTFMETHHPELKTDYVVQEEMKGQSHAIYLARDLLHGPMIMIFSDTLIETTFSFLDDESADAVAWVKSVPDPRRFGVAIEGLDGLVTKLVEKPDSMENKLAVVGCYYFKKAQDLIAAIEQQMSQEMMLKGEYFLVDALNIMLADGLKMRTQNVDIWLDAGTHDALLETNAYLLEHGRDNTQEAQQRSGVQIVPPVFIHPSADIENAVIGPNTSIGQNCHIVNSVIRESILDRDVMVTSSVLEGALLGHSVNIHGRAHAINAGDDSEIIL